MRNTMHNQPNPTASQLSLVIAFWLGLSVSAIAQITGPPVESLVDANEETVENAAADASDSKLDNDQEDIVRFDELEGSLDEKANQMLKQMTLKEKIGQLVQIYPNDEEVTEDFAAEIRNGSIGSIFYPGTAKVVRESQRIAREESRLGIPLIVARDVIHGFRTMFPIPLGQAATWDADLIEEAAKISADEAASEGIDWTFAPMVDICRDARWGRIAETLGEDPYLCGQLGSAMVRGFQQETDEGLDGVAACAKHFVGYGLVEGGRDYNRASVSQSELHNVFLHPFESSVVSGCRTMMTTFSELNGVPGTGHEELVNGVLKNDWGFSGVVVSDWASITEMIAHGYSRDERESAIDAMLAGVDVDMCSQAYNKYLPSLVKDGTINEERLNDAVLRVLKLKMEVKSDADFHPYEMLQKKDLQVARDIVAQSMVLLKNEGTLPLVKKSLKKVAVIGPMAHAPQQQIGCWSLDAKAENSITPLAGLMIELAGQAEVIYSKGAENTFSDNERYLKESVEAAEGADVALLFIGEDTTLSGEARCRADISLPGVQAKLVKQIAETDTPVVIVFMAGRPLSIGNELELADAVLYAWHPGTMAGPAIADILLGKEVPSGKLPVTFPREVGQIPLYYNHPNTGRPAPKTFRPLFGSGEDDLTQANQYSSHYLDVVPTPLFPFGYGLSYTEFEYSDLKIEKGSLYPEGTLRVSVKVTNTGAYDATETVQLYTQDKFAKVVRPVRELKAFERVAIKAGESVIVELEVPADRFAYVDNSKQKVLEPGAFNVWVGGSSEAELMGKFRIDLPSAKSNSSRIQQAKLEVE